MQTVQLKLKQASAVLGVGPKDLQNLVQLKVLRPPRRDGFYWFDANMLLEAKLAFYLKEALGTSTGLLTRFTAALSQDLRDKKGKPRRYVWLRSRPARGEESIEVRIPLRNLKREIEARLPMANVYKDLPRGRKRPGWRRDFLRSLSAAAGDLSDAAEPEIAQAVRGYRAEKKRLPEVSVGRPKKAA